MTTRRKEKGRAYWFQLRQPLAARLLRELAAQGKASERRQRQSGNAYLGTTVLVRERSAVL